MNIAPETAAEKIVPILIKHLNDSVPNIRFLTIKILREVATKIESPQVLNDIKKYQANLLASYLFLISSFLLSTISGLLSDNDKDVKFFAQETLQLLR